MNSRHLLGAVVALALLAPAARAQGTVGTDQAKVHKTAKHHETEADLMKLATITKDSATTVALGAVPGGTVKSSEIEREKKHVVYSFDVAVDGKEGVEEVLVDAKTGKILKQEHESAKKERKEARKEAKKNAKAASKP
jgi:uncharacterized membrane protein YkoI